MLKDPQEALQGARELLLVGSALEVGIFAALGNRALSATGIASKLGLDRRAVWTVAEALAEAGYLAKRGSAYRLTAQSKDFFIRPSSPSYVADSVMHSYQQMGRWLSLPQVLKEGQPKERWRPPEALGHLVRALGKGAERIAPKVVEECLGRAPSAKSLLDLGGGQGVYAKEFARSGLSVTLFDVPEAIEIAAAYLKGEEGITLVAGNFLESLPSGPFDIAFLGNVCHIYGPEENRALFSRLRPILSTKGLLAILDFVRGHSPIAATFGVNMLVSTQSGGTWTEAEYSQWLTQSDFCRVKIHHIEGRQLILAEKE